MRCVEKSKQLNVGLVNLIWFGRNWGSQTELTLPLQSFTLMHFPETQICISVHTASSRWEWNMQREFVYRCEVGLVMTSVSGRHQETPLPGGRSLWRVLVSPGCCRAGRLGHAPRNRPGALSSLGVLQRLTALLTTHTFVIFSRSLWCTVSLCGYVGWL